MSSPSKWLDLSASEDNTNTAVAVKYRFLNSLNNPHQFGRMVCILGKCGSAKSFLLSGLLEKPNLFRSERNKRSVTSGADVYFQENRSCAWIDVEGFGLRGSIRKLAAIPLFTSNIVLLNCAIIGGRIDYHSKFISLSVPPSYPLFLQRYSIS
jgi:hypothetical protein